jgi:hypothetical protein
MSNIWDEFKKRYPDAVLDTDGIVDEEHYRQEKTRILFILKETNELNGSLCEFLKNGAPGNGRKTWQPCCKWAKTILDGTCEPFRSDEERKGILRRIAAINLKKTSGTSQSDNTYIGWANNNIDLLKRQILEIDPQVIVLCCNKKGNNLICEQLLDGTTCSSDPKVPSLSTAKWGDRLIISARHPLFAANRWIEDFKKFHHHYIACEKQS